MVRITKNTARLVVQGTGVLGILLGFLCVLAGITGLFSIRREDFPTLCLMLSVSVMLLVVGAWLARDSYLMLRGKAFEAIKAISGLLAFVVFGWIESLLRGVDDALLVGVKDALSGLEGPVAVSIVFLATWLPSPASAVLVYLVCTKLLNRLVKVAYGPQDISGKQDSEGKPGTDHSLGQEEVRRIQ